MPAEEGRAAQNRWCDVNGAHVTIFSWVEQVAEHPKHATLFSRLHQRGQVVGRGPDVLYVRIQGRGQVIGVPPQLVRLLPDQPGNACR